MCNQGSSCCWWIIIAIIILFLLCGNCGSCKGNFQSVDITREAQIILSCVKRVHDALGYNVGANLLGNILRGSRNKRVQGPCRPRL